MIDKTTAIRRAALVAAAAGLVAGLAGCEAPPVAHPLTYYMQPAPPPPAPMPQRFVLAADTMFAFDSAELSPAGQRRIADLAAHLPRGTVHSVQVLGYTDRLGTMAYNMDLSRRRAESVRAALIANGVPDDAIWAEGRGPLEPKVSCDGSGAELIACLAPNRRVEVNADGVR
jgi:OmpA-OmpF porin, OOP family